MYTGAADTSIYAADGGYTEGGGTSIYAGREA
jgi:hypothetical protein